MIGPNYKVGNLRDIVTVQRRGQGSDGFGNKVTSWSTLREKIPAQISPMKGGEAVRANRLASVSNYEVVVRGDAFTATVKASDRLINGRTGHAYDIKSALNLDERGRWITLTCVAVG